MKNHDRSQVNTISVRKVHPLSGNYVARLLTFLPLYLPPRPRYTYIRALRGPFGSAWADAYTRACRRDKTDVSALNGIRSIRFHFVFNKPPLHTILSTLLSIVLFHRWKKHLVKLVSNITR